MRCPDCGARDMGTSRTVKTTRRTTRILECPCGAAFETEESIVARLRSGSRDALMRISANGPPDLALDPVGKEANFRATEAVQARNPQKFEGDNGGGLPSDRIARPDLALVSRSGSRTDLGLDLFPVDPPAPALRLASSETVAPKKSRRVRVAVNPVYSEAFKVFWARYPGRRKNEPDLCWEIWQRDGMDTIAEEIMAALGWQVETEDWTKEGGQFVPAPVRYLRRRRWKDERPGRASAVRVLGSQDEAMLKRIKATGYQPG